MSGAHAARMAFTPLPSSIGGFSAIAEDSFLGTGIISRDEVKAGMKVEAEEQRAEVDVQEQKSPAKHSADDHAHEHDGK
jgi:hypothetical protein